MRLRKQAGGCPRPLTLPMPRASSGSAQQLFVVQRGQPGDLRAVLPFREAQLVKLLQIEPEFARRPEETPQAKCCVAPVTARRPLRISVIRFVGTSIRRASSAALMPSASRSSRSVSPGWMGSRVTICLRFSGSPLFPHWSDRGFPPAIRNKPATDRKNGCSIARCGGPSEPAVGCPGGTHRKPLWRHPAGPASAMRCARSRRRLGLCFPGRTSPRSCHRIRQSTHFGSTVVTG